MLTVTGLSGQTEAISKFSNFEMYEEVNGVFTLSFVSFSNANNPGHDLISEESIIEYEGYEFRVKQLRTSPISKNVSATSIYFDTADMRKYDIYGGTHTLDEFLTYVLAGTGWTFINEDITKSVFIPDFGNDNVVKLVDILKSAFECEMKIEPGKVLRFATQLGPDNDAQYRYGHNIIALSESIDTTKLKTYIEGFGANALHVTYTSPLAASPGIGIRHAEPIRDDRFTEANLLLDFIKRELHDYPESTIELDAVELQDKEIGEKVWLIHEKMGIEYQTRVMAKRTRIPKNLSSITLGNHKPKSVGGLLASQKIEIDRNRQEYRSKIEQTNDNIKLEVTRLDGNIATANSSIELNADEIALRVKQTTYDNDINAVGTGLKDRVTSAESSITQNANQIALRVTQEIYNADINAVGTGLKDRLSSAESSISLNTNEIALKVSQEIYNNDINAVGTGLKDRLSSAESSISLNTNEIALRVTQEFYDNEINAVGTGIKDRLSSAESSISLNTNEIALKVSQTDYNGDTIVGMINLSSSTVKIEAANIDLVGQVTFNDLTVAVQDTINAKVDSWSLGDLAYQDMVEKAKLGTTIISGGYIASSLLTADNIVTGTLSGNMITGGTIVGSTIKLQEGAMISPFDIAGIRISASDIWLTDGRVDLSMATSVNWGSHAPVARFG